MSVDEKIDLLVMAIARLSNACDIGRENRKGG